MDVNASSSVPAIGMVEGHSSVYGFGWAENGMLRMLMSALVPPVDDGVIPTPTPLVELLPLISNARNQTAMERQGVDLGVECTRNIEFVAAHEVEEEEEEGQEEKEEEEDEDFYKEKAEKEGEEEEAMTSNTA